MLSGNNNSNDASSSLSGVSGTTYSPKSSIHVGTSSSSLGISSNNSSIKSIDNNSSNTNNENNMNMPNNAEKNNEASLQRANSNDEESIQSHSLPVYSKSSTSHDQSEEMLSTCSQDLFNSRNQSSDIELPIKYATSTPFIAARKKEQAHYSSLQLSGGSSVVDKSRNLSSVSDLGANHSKLSSPSEAVVVEKKLRFDSPSLYGIKKDGLHFSSIQLSGGSSVAEKFHDRSLPSDEYSSNFSKPSNDIVEKKLSFDSPSNDSKIKNDFHFSSMELSGESSISNKFDTPDASNLRKPELMGSPSDELNNESKNHQFFSPLTHGGGFIRSEKSSETLDIPQWCKGFVDPNSESNSIISEKFQRSATSEVTTESASEDIVHDQGNVTNELSLSLDVEKEIENKSLSTSSSVPDIFNPVLSQMTQDKSSTQVLTQLSYVPNSIDENLPHMNFELSQSQPDFQVERDAEGFTSLQQKVNITISNEENDKNKDAKKESNDDSQKPTCSKSMNINDNGNSSAISCTVDNKDLSTSLSDISKCDLSEENYVFRIGMPIFALWNKIYYPGVVVKLEDSTSLTVHFHDDQVVTMPRKNVFFHDLVSTHGHLCKVILVEEFYDDAIIMAAYTYDNEIYYTVLANGEHTVVDRNSICFTQIQRQKIFLKCVSNQIIITRKRRRTEPVLSSGSENYFIAKSPSKRIKLHLKLFEGITIYIIPDDTPILCSSIVTSSMEEDPQIEDFPFNVEELKKIIEENGGVCIPKLHGRDMKHANKLVCVARSYSASLPFIYSVVVGIPILHYDWIHRSIEAKRIKQYEKGEYLLPAGIDIFGDVVEQNIKIRAPYTPLNPLRFYVHVDGELKNQNRLVDMILYKSGCERLFSSMYVTAKTKKMPFNIHNIDFVLTMVSNVPKSLVNAAEKAGKNIVTSTWFVQCLINNQLLDTMDCSVFRYSEPVIIEGHDNEADNQLAVLGELSTRSQSPEFE